MSKQQRPGHSSSISLWIDGYDDLFSDFDSRNFSQRNVSDDFIDELKKLVHETKVPLKELKLLAPEKSRNQEIENMIIERLHQHFEINEETRSTKKSRRQVRGSLLVFAGIMCLMVASFISFRKPEDFWMHSLIVIFEPAGWFLAWTGMDRLLDIHQAEKPDLEFYRKLSMLDISFDNIPRENENTTKPKTKNP